ncbi:hypothetical protein QTO34_011480, partial [Cnephaeus nilssonii]
MKGLELIETLGMKFWHQGLTEMNRERKGTDVNVFNTILTTRSYPHLCRVFQKYTKYSQHGEQVLELEMKDDAKNCFTALATSSSHERCWKCHETLVRIMVSCFEIDMNDTKTCYQKLYGISLCQVILDETKGDYEKVLVALFGG